MRLAVDHVLAFTLGVFTFACDHELQNFQHALDGNLVTHSASAFVIAAFSVSLQVTPPSWIICAAQHVRLGDDLRHLFHTASETQRNASTVPSRLAGSTR